ncbi:tape measure protein [Lactobacillus crispatus]|uniref:aggregation-promoting factor C-terminal-like domain-containing protein n=1 Tax=Lactobacillus crispatus TaxID=47770 RepID=UPI0018E3C355|nr:tape measure protein [Lactobacillus crispatus]MBI1704681.1 SLT domain-containing protein [Lactobacillus crispatus]MBI1704731.1 SLT domain-containing protein [Lactobacillus crispatus]
MADGTIKIDIDIPVNKVKSDSHAVNEELERIGKNAGKDMDSSFKKNADSVKREAKSTGESIDKSIGREHKTKIKVDSSEAKTKINETKHDLDKIPKKHETKVDADASQFNRKVDEAKHKTNELPKKHNTDIDATDHTGGVFARIKSHFDGINERGEKTHSLFKTIFSANVISNAATSAFGAVKGALGGMYQEAKQYALEQQTMNATWLTLTNSASKGQAMVKQINNMAVAAQNSTEMVDQLSQKFYAINNNAKQTGELTKSILTLQDAFGQTDAAVENFGTQFSQMMANGKVSAQDMMSIVNTFPKLRPMLLDYERRIHHSSHMTMQEMNKMMSDGKIKSQDMINVVLEAGKKFNKATGNFTKTIPGMTRVVKSQMPVLLGAFTKPLAKMESPVYAAVAKWVSSKKTNKEFQNLGKTVSTGMNNVMKAFSGGKTVNVTKALDSAINGINKGLKGVFGWISGHAKDLKTIGSSIASIGGQLAKAVWKDFASIITTIGNMFGLTAKHGKSSSSAIHVIAEALNSLAKNKTAIKAIADAIVAIAVVKGLDRVGGGLFAIGQKGYKAYRNIKALKAGLKGVQDVKDFSKTEQGFVRIGSAARSAAKWVRGLFSASKGGAGKLTGLLQSAHSAGGFKNLTTAGKIGTGLAGAGVALDAGSSFLNAFKDRHNADKRSQDIGKGIGAGIGGGIGLWFGGPAGAAIGAQIGKVVGSWGGKAVNNFTKGWQRHKPPKRFWSLENLGWSTHDMFSKAGKWGSETGKNLVKGVKNGSKGFSKWLHDLPGNMHKGWKQGVEKSHKVMAKFWSDTGKGWNKMWKNINSNRYVKAFKKGKLFQTALKDMRSRFKSFKKWFGKNWNATWKSINSNRYVKAFKNGKFFQIALKDMKSRWSAFKKWFGKNWNSFWKSTKKWAKDSWNGTVKNWNGFWDSINKGWKDFKTGFGKGWNSFWGHLGNVVKGWSKTIKDDFTGTINNIIGGFNDVVHAMGGGKKTIGFLHFANGTDWRKRWATPAILNDGTDSPQTHNRESIIHANGWWELLPDKANLKRFLLPDDEVVNAKDTARIFGNAVHFANGSLPYGISLPSVSYSQVAEKALKRLQRINEEQLQLAKKEARRKQARDTKKDRQKKNSKKKHSKSENYSSDTRKVKGSILVDKGLLFGSRKEANKNTYVNEKLFKRLMSYTKAKPIKVSKNSRIRYRDLPTRRQGKYYLVDSKWLTGAKNNTGKLEKLDRESYLKLLQFTKAERKYKLPKKKRKTTRKRTTTRRTTTRRSTASRVHSAVSTGGYSVGRVSSAISSVSASVKGLGSVKALSKALKGIKGKHKVTVTAKASGSKSITKLAKSIKKVTGKHKVTIKTKGLSSLKSLYKAAKKIKGSTHKVRVKTSGTSSLKKLRSAISKVADESKKATKDIKGKGNFAKAFESLTKTTDKTLSKLRSNAEKDFKSMWSNLKKATSSGVSKINHDTSSFNSKFTRQWRSLTSGAEKIFNKFWSTMKSSARSGLNDVIGVLNSAIGKIDTVVSQFGGSKNAVHKVTRLATGTGALGGVRRPITAPTLAILNDGYDSPETGNQEAIWDRNTGNVEVVPGRFTPRILKPGQEVFNATETAMLGYTTPQHFATGTGALKELYHIAKNNWEHPQKTGQALFGAVTGLTGAINQLAQGAKKQGEDQGIKWWSQLWKMVDDKVNSDDLGPASGLLKAVEQMGEGAIYSQAKRMAKGFYDCSSLVSRALKKYYHANWATPNGWALTVETLWPHAHKIPKSEARPGDPVFWLPNGHVGIYAGHGMYYSAFGPEGAKNSVGMHPLSWGVTGVSPTFGRFNGINTESNKSKDPKVKANNALQKKIRDQVGKGFWKTIDKIQEEFGPKDDDGLQAGKPTGDHMNWLKEAHIPRKYWGDFNYIISAESGWNPHASNGNHWGMGQMSAENMHYYSRHGNKWNPIAQIMGIWDYIKDRYGTVEHAVSFRKAHNWYARGGIVTSPQTAVVGEGNGPESIIPWDPAYRGRAYQIMQATLDQFKAQDGKSQLFQNQAQQAVDLTKTNAEIQAINDKFDEALAALGILTSQNDVIQVNNYIDKRKIGEAMYSIMKRMNIRSNRNSRYNISGH